ncbi:MAG: AbrB/MazE/SpoVT family DNA-binding domain-containing protein [Candidatus Kapabacteria bacterium]|nr:AbrB/MazE/SpoVT family DNA-binding domain-containing protein [Candidatus Kapabacteria bacterium]MBX7156058.1 AbrB/MazE/SpoVT family DNA-binding domain-containing protein [Bacteroidota bacterium]
MRVATIDIQNPNGMQAITIPNDMRIDDDKVYVKKVGNAIQIIPYHNPWKNLTEGAAMFTDDYMQQRNQQQQHDRESFE